MIDMNMWNFKKLIKKASISYLIPSISLELRGKDIISTSISPDNNAIVFLKCKDNIITDESNDGIDLNFFDISTNLKPYLDLIKDENVKIDITENKLIIKDSEKKKFSIFFCSKDFTNRFSGPDRSDKHEYFYNSVISKDFINKMNDIKKIALKFGKIYFVCKNGKFFMEATDKTNPFCNNVNVEIDKVDNKDLDISMCFDFKNLSYIINTLDEIENFKLKCTYLPEAEAGMILFQSENEVEKYFITSKKE